MAQITLYIDDELQGRLKAAASEQGVSQSQYVAELIRRATSRGWPKSVLEMAGSVPDFPLAEELRAGMPPDAERVIG